MLDYKAIKYIESLEGEDKREIFKKRNILLYEISYVMSHSDRYLKGQLLILDNFLRKNDIKMEGYKEQLNRILY